MGNPQLDQEMLINGLILLIALIAVYLEIRIQSRCKFYQYDEDFYKIHWKWSGRMILAQRHGDNLIIVLLYLRSFCIAIGVIMATYIYIWK